MSHCNLNHWIHLNIRITPNMSVTNYHLLQCQEQDNYLDRITLLFKYHTFSFQYSLHMHDELILLEIFKIFSMKF